MLLRHQRHLGGKSSIQHFDRELNDIQKISENSDEDATGFQENHKMFPEHKFYEEEHFYLLVIVVTISIQLVVHSQSKKDQFVIQLSHFLNFF